MGIVLALFMILISCQVQSANWLESPQIRQLFNDAGVRGTFVLYDATTGADTGFDEARATRRLTPASTFKMANALIGLDVGAVSSVDEILPYRGPDEPLIKAWKQDMGLRQAIALSNVPVFQELARRIGPVSMRDGLKRLEYGNQEMGAMVDHFWLDGTLQISAIEQTRFLARLAQGQLPMAPGAQQAVRDITLLERGTHWVLHGKTGWENAPGSGVGWWVGWVDHQGRIDSFALNMDIVQASDAPKRSALGKSCLKALGFLDDASVR